MTPITDKHEQVKRLIQLARLTMEFIRVVRQRKMGRITNAAIQLLTLIREALVQAKEEMRGLYIPKQ